MADYIAQADIENVFGVDNVKIWSDLQGTGTLDSTRIDAAIAYAEEELNNRFRNGKYELPFAPVTNVIKYWAAAFAGLWLFDSRPLYKQKGDEFDGFEKMREQLEVTIDMYTSGQRVLGCTTVEDAGQTGPRVV